MKIRNVARIPEIVGTVAPLLIGWLVWWGIASVGHINPVRVQDVYTGITLAYACSASAIRDFVLRHLLPPPPKACENPSLAP